MIVIVLPAYNEELSLPQLFAKIKATMAGIGQPYRIVICDDGSSDATRAVAESYRDRLPLDILVHRINRGLGETIRDLFEYAVDICAPEDVIVRMDCDDTHEPDTIQAMIEALDKGYDVALASRFAPGGGQVGVVGDRAFLTWAARLYMRIVFPIPGVREYSCGFRAYRAALLRQAIAFYGNNFIQLRGLGFTGTLEKLVKLHLLNARFIEVPFTLRYDQKVSASKMVASITTLGYFALSLMYHWPWGGWRRFVRRKGCAAGCAGAVSGGASRQT